MRRRSGFTLVELMVAMALIMFLMAILSEAFVAALKSFRDLKATADLAERLRAANTILRRELNANHFDGQSRLSQPDFYLNGPRPEGFFRIYQGSTAVRDGDDALEGTTPQAQRQLSGFHATDHMLHFTVKLRGNERGDYFTAGNIPATGAALTSSPLFRGNLHYQDSANVYSSQWAEVAYFLRQLPDTANGTPLYALYRRQLLLVPDNGLLTSAVTKAGSVPASITTAQYEYPEMSCRYVGTNVFFNNPRDVTMPVRRFGMNPASLAGVPLATDPRTGAASYPTMVEDTNTPPLATPPANPTYAASDVLLSDVLSFEVKVLPAITQTGGPHFVDLFDADLVQFNQYSNPMPPPPLLPNNPSFPAASRVYDTWSSMVEKSPTGTPTNDYSAYAMAGQAQSIPFTTALRLKAIQVTIRVWDVKTEQTRQITIVQDL